MQDSLITSMTTHIIGIRIKPLTLNSFHHVLHVHCFSFFSIKDNKKRCKLKCYKRDFPNIDTNGWGYNIENKYA